MKFAASLKSLVLLAATLALSACGGGGGSDSDGGFTPTGLSLTTSTTTVSSNPRSLVTITATLRQANGGVLADGATITATVNGAGLGNLSTGNGTNGGTATGNTVGGVVNFYFQTGGTPGTGSITFSAADATTTTRTVTRTVNVTIGNGPGSDPRISFVPNRTEIPINTDGVPIFIGSPYISEVLVNVRSASGQPINDDGDGDQAIQFAITPTALGAVSVLDDPDTTDINEFTTPFGSIFTGVAAGTARAFVWSSESPGALTLRAAFTDPDTGQRAEAIYVFNIGSNVPPLPGAITINAPTSAIYVNTSGGQSSGPISVSVTDGAGTPVPNPVQGSSAFNNVRLEILPTNQTGDAVLSGTNAAGVLQEGRTIVVRTTNGIANALVRAGVQTGTYVLRATTDRADNNVDNGITSPVTAERTFVISDGRLFDIEITQPATNALLVNPVSTSVTPPAGGTPTVPVNPDGSYSLTIAAIATDRLGNPVIPGTVVRFGLIDEPQATGFGDFLISGNDGNPQESGTLFTAVSGRFQTAGGGVGPGDALVVFGEDVIGNRDLESARVVARVNSQTSLNVTRRFNANDDTGTSVDYGGILPYIIGRAADGNITATGVTNEFGVVRTTMNYPVSQLGKYAVIWAESDGDVVGGTAETVTDVEFTRFAGVAPGNLTVSPSSLPANGTYTVDLCVSDFLGSPIGGVSIGFSFQNLSGQGSVDGIATSGTVDSLTDASGCTTAQVTTAGAVAGEGGAEGATLVFSAVGDTAEVTFTFSPLALLANPSALSGSGTVTLTLVDGAGVRQPGFQIVGTCTSANGALISITSPPGITNAQGQTTAGITANNLNQVNAAGSGECTFQTVDGSATAIVTLQGQDVCALGISPPNPGCETDPIETAALTVQLSSAGASGFAVTSTPDGITCSVGANRPANNPQECSGEFEVGDVVTIRVVGAVNTVTFSGECAVITAGRTANATISGDGNICIITQNP